MRSYLLSLILTAVCSSQIFAAPFTQLILNKTSTALPATDGIYITENNPLHFSTSDHLKQVLTGPYAIESDVVNKVIEKLTPFIGSPLYPSRLAYLMFELAFLDNEEQRLTAKERTANIGYALSNLGNGKAATIQSLFAFYYGYSFEHFAKKK